jgi:matrixin
MNARFAWLSAVAVLVAIGGIVATGQTIAPLQPDAGTGRVTYFIGPGEPKSEFRASDTELATWALRAWEKAVDGALHFEPAREDEALVQVHWVGPAGGQYGEMRPLLVKGRRGAAVFIRPDTNALGDDIARMAKADPLLRESIVYLTCVHELGHALGLEHTAAYADIMFFFGYGGDIPGFFTRYRTQLKSRTDIQNVSGLSTDDLRRVRALYPKRLRAQLQLPKADLKVGLYRH